jgi:hypothetical protein
MRTLALTILVYDGPIARAYLCGLRRAGLRPAKVMLLAIDARRRDASFAWKWLPAGFRTRVACKAQELSHNYWAREIQRRHPALVDAMASAASCWQADAASVYTEMYGRFAFEEYADEVHPVLVEGYSDPGLASPLRNLAEKTVLFTGGGIVPRALLALDGVRFIHVHPGCVPLVRGSDGLLWSTLVRGAPGATVFFLNERIDMGDVIESLELGPFKVVLGRGERPDDLTLYRATFAFLDPLLRLHALLRVLERCEPESLAGRPQDAVAGRTYHFMTDEMRAVALRKIFVDGV